MVKTRGEQRFAAVTYSAIADWVGLSVDSVRKYSARNAFDRDSIESVLTWVNARRAAKGWNLIGMPNEHPAEVLPPITASKDSTKPSEVTIDWIGDGKALPRPASGGYNPLTGEFEQ